MDELNPDEEEGANKRRDPNDAVRGGAVDLYGGVGRFHGWPSSRIVRVSRASGGKDRHSKVLTSKGLRDRRVRLSVNTAIQFYDLQDRLGLDQPSKAVEWLLKAAAASITDLPPMSNPFPDSPKQQLSDEKIKLSSAAAGSDLLAFDSGEVDMDGGEISYLRQQMPTKSSACSNNSETSKGSGLSLSRSENWMKSDKKEKEGESSHVASFTELLSGGINSFNNAHNGGSFRQNPNRRGGGGGGDAIQSSDYFKTGLLGQLQFANSPKSVAAGSNHHHHHHNHNAEFQNFAFPAAGGNGGSSEYNLNFTISSANNSPSFTAFNRGTLQSNSPPPSLLSHDIQRFNNPPADDGSTPNFFISGGGAAAPVENHNHFLSGFDAGLHLYYGDAHSNKGKLEKK